MNKNSHRVQAMPRDGVRRRFTSFAAAPRALVAAVLLLAFAFAPAAHAQSAAALPTGGQIAAGAGSFATTGSTLTVQQTSPSLSVNWQGFDIGADATVNFVQPGRNSVALNRVLGADPSRIFGRLNANGQIFLINPNGILFGRTAQVNVGGLVASTLDLSDDDFLAGHRRFSGTAGAVTNHGNIDGGYVALLGGQVSNQGTISARLGTVALAAGSDLTLDFAGDGLLGVQVNRGTLDALAENKQLIRADGGNVLLTALAADRLLQAVVNNTGVIEARTLENRGGTIKLLGDMAHGTVNVAGTLDASAPESGVGGFIETSAAAVKIADGAKITTRSATGQSGTWLIDPVDFTIAGGSGALTTSGIGASTLSTSLGSGNVNIATDASTAGNGDIFVNAPVTWSSNTLTFTAHRNIEINANLNGSGTAKLALEYAQGGGAGDYLLSNGAKVSLPAGLNFRTKNGGAAAIDWTVITTLGVENSTTGTDLQGMFGTNVVTPANLAGNYVLGADINAAATAGWAGGFKPIGYNQIFDPNVKAFSGRFDGLGHTISNLYINRPGEDVGLFGWTVGTALKKVVLQNVGLLNVNMTGGNNGATGGLVGRATHYTIIRNSYVDGGSVSTTDAGVGGLAGVSDTGSDISHSYANVSVYAAVGLSGYAAAGGLVGANNATLSYSYATGSVSAPAGNVNSMFIGGLAGMQNAAGSSTSYCYATGAVSGNNTLGGLIGRAQAGTPVTGSYWDKTTTGQATSSGSASSFGLTTAQWLTNGPFVVDPANWNATNWAAGNPYPGIKTLPYVTITASASQTYGSAATLGIASILDQTGANASGLVNTGGLTWLNNTTATTAAGTTSSVGGSGATATGYQVLYAGSVTVGKASLTVTANNAAKTYDRLAWSGGNGVSYSGFVNGETSAVLGGTLTYGGTAQGAVNAGSYTLTASGLTSGNYTFAYVDGALTVNKAALRLTASSATKTYDGTTASTGTVNVTGLIAGDTLTGLMQSYTSKNVLGANGSTLAVNSGYTLADGNGGANYNVTSATATGTITPAALTLTGTRTYDGTANVAGSILSFSNLVVGDSVAATGSGTLSSRNVGTQSLANVGTLALDNTNYTLTGATGTVTITPAALTLTASTGTKTYDGTTASGGTVSVAGLAAGDTLSGLTQSYTSKNVLGANGSTLTVNSGYTLADGNAGRNYTVTTANATGTITPAALTLTASTGTKTYDGTTASSGTVNVAGLITGDTLSGVTQSYASKNVLGANGSTLTVNSGYTLADGNGGNNYAVTKANAAGTITPATLTLAASSATKIYDGTTASTGNVSVAGLVAGDTLSGLAQGYTSKNVLGANGSTLIVNGSYTLADGNGGANYTVTATNASGTITPATLTLAASSATKIYDGTTSSTGAVSVTGLAAGDTLSGLTQGYASKNAVGANGSKLVVNAGYMLADGNGGNNYTVTTTNAAGTIAPRPVTLAGTRSYDRTVAIAGSNLSLGNLVTGDTVAVTGSGTLASRNAGTQGLASVGTLVLDNANYTLAGATGSVTITPAALILTASSGSKIYDGTTSSTGTVSVVGLVAGDTLSGLTQSYGNKNVLGTNGSTLVVNTGYTLADGNGGNNYTVTTANAAGTITPAALTLAATSGTKKYDGTTASTGNVGVTGLVTGDTLSGLTQSYANKNALGINGSTLVVNAGYTLADGNGGSNYTVTTANAAGTITPAALTLAATSGTKAYDGTIASTGAVRVTGLVAGDTLSSLTQSYASKNALGANGSTLVVNTGYTLADGNGGNNYTVTTTNATATISPRAVTLTGTRSYDGTVNVAGSTLSATNLAPGDSLEVSGNTTVAGSALGTYSLGDFGALALNNANYTLTGATGSVTIVAPPAIDARITPVLVTVLRSDPIAAGAPLGSAGVLFDVPTPAEANPVDASTNARTPASEFDDRARRKRKVAELLFIEAGGIRLPAGLTTLKL